MLLIPSWTYLYVKPRWVLCVIVVVIKVHVTIMVTAMNQKYKARSTCTKRRIGFKSWRPHIPELFHDFRRCVFSGKRLSGQLRDVYDDFVNLKIICQLSLLEVLIGIKCACVRS